MLKQIVMGFFIGVGFFAAAALAHWIDMNDSTIKKWFRGDK